MEISFWSKNIYENVFRMVSGAYCKFKNLWFDKVMQKCTELEACDKLFMFATPKVKKNNIKGIISQEIKGIKYYIYCSGADYTIEPIKYCPFCGGKLRVSYESI